MTCQNQTVSCLPPATGRSRDLSESDCQLSTTSHWQITWPVRIRLSAVYHQPLADNVTCQNQTVSCLPPATGRSRDLSETDCLLSTTSHWQITWPVRNRLSAVYHQPLAGHVTCQNQTVSCLPPATGRSRDLSETDCQLSTTSHWQVTWPVRIRLSAVYHQPLADHVTCQNQTVSCLPPATGRSRDLSESDCQLPTTSHLQVTWPVRIRLSAVYHQPLAAHVTCQNQTVSGLPPATCRSRDLSESDCQRSTTSHWQVTWPVRIRLATATNHWQITWPVRIRLSAAYHQPLADHVTCQWQLLASCQPVEDWTPTV